MSSAYSGLTVGGTLNEEGWMGDLAFAAAWDRELSDSERDDLAQYIANTYDLTIDDAPNGIVRYKFQDDDLSVKDKKGRGTQFQFVAESEDKRHISKIAEINLASTFASNAVVD